LQDALGSKLAEMKIGMVPHTLRSEVLEIVEDARKVDADGIVAPDVWKSFEIQKLVTRRGVD